MDEKFTHKGIVFDDRDGLGAVTDALDVAYKGFLVHMRPSMFLALCPPLPEGRTAVDDLIEGGAAIGTPFLVVDIEDEERAVRQHEGRHRMRAVLRLAGDDPVPVAMLLSHGARARDVAPEVVVSFCRRMRQEWRRGDVPPATIDGPIFERAFLRGEEIDLDIHPTPAL